MATGFDGFRYLTFDVVGTLIDFETGITDCLAQIAEQAGVPFDGEQALSLYRAARYIPEVQPFPDDLVRVYSVIAPKLGLPSGEANGQRLRDSVKGWAMASLAKRYKLIAMTNAQRWAFEYFAAAQAGPGLLRAGIALRRKLWRHDRAGARFTKPDFHFTSMADLAAAGEASPAA